MCELEAGREGGEETDAEDGLCLLVLPVVVVVVVAVELMKQALPSSSGDK